MFPRPLYCSYSSLTIKTGGPLSVDIQNAGRLKQLILTFKDEQRLKAKIIIVHLSLITLRGKAAIN